MSQGKEPHSESCYHCKHLDYIDDTDSDGYTNQKNSGWYCGFNAKPVYNLKSFPFKKPMECFERKVSNEPAR